MVINLSAIMWVSLLISASLADKFTVLSFLEALEDSVSKSSEESMQDDKDLRSESCNPMDESQ